MGCGRVYALIIGTATGLMVAGLYGRYGAREISTVAGYSLFSLPFQNYLPPVPQFITGAIIPMLLIAVVGAVDEIGSGIMIDKINTDKWSRWSYLSHPATRSKRPRTLTPYSAWYG